MHILSSSSYIDIEASRIGTARCSSRFNSDEEEFAYGGFEVYPR